MPPIPAVPSPPVRLDAAPRGRGLLIAGVAEEHRASLAQEGVAEGVELEIESIVPFGGPVIVRLGVARVALARSVARTIEVVFRVTVTAGGTVRDGGRSSLGDRAEASA